MGLPRLAELRKGSIVHGTITQVTDYGGWIDLGLKQLQPDPWETLADRLPVGIKTPGKVVGVKDYGVFVEIAEGIEGLIHSSMLREPWPQLGDTLEVRVLSFDIDERKLILEPA